MDCGRPCYVAYRRVGARPETVVAVVADTSELSAATRRLALTVTIGAATVTVPILAVLPITISGSSGLMENSWRLDSSSLMASTVGR
jgi:hypothetical protein